MLIDDLVDLKAVESAAVIEEVFAAGAADTLFARDWEQTQVDLGLLPERVTPRPRYIPLTRLLHAPEIRIIPPDAAANAKRRRKAQKAARQRNRRRR